MSPIRTGAGARLRLHLVGRKPIAPQALRLPRRTLLWAGFALPALAPQAACSPEQDAILLGLIEAGIDLLSASKGSFGRGEDVGGRVRLVNAASEAVSGYLSLAVVRATGQAVDSGRGVYDVPRYTVNEYEWSGLSCPDAGQFQASAASALASRLSELFDVF